MRSSGYTGPDTHILDREITTRIPVSKEASGAVVLTGVSAYVNAGGRGTRLNSIFEPDEAVGVSKALLGIGRPAIPLIEHQVNKLLAAGMSDIVVGAGDHVHVAEHVATRYARHLGVWPIHASVQLGNGGDLLQAFRDHNELFGEHVAISNVDTLLDLDESTMARFHRECDADITIALTLNPGVPNEGAFYVDTENRVVHCEETGERANRTARRATAYRGSSTGALIVKREVLAAQAWQPADGPLSLYRDIMRTVLQEGSVYAFNNGDRLFTDVGTVDTWLATQDSPDAIEPYLYRRDSSGD